MANLTGKQILDAVMSKIHDSSYDMREKFLLWLPGIVSAVLIERDWQFAPDLRKSVDIEIIESGILLPADFEEELNIRIGSAYFLDRDSRLTDEAAFIVSADFPASTEPQGYQIDATKITFIPGAQGTATLCYRPSLSALADDATATAWPDEFLNLFVRGLLTGYYEFDLHPGIGYSAALDEVEMRRLKIWDNRHRPKPGCNAKGYVREAG